MSGHKTVYSKNKGPCFVMAFSIFYIIRNSIIYYIQTNSTGYTLSKSRKMSIYQYIDLGINVSAHNGPNTQGTN